MLKKSSRQVSGKPTLMADSFSLPSPTNNYNKPLTSPLFPLSPRAFINFSPKPYSNFDSAMSPTSILETKTNPFLSETNTRTEQTQQKSSNYHQPIGLGIVDALKKPSKPESKKIFFGSQLKIQIPKNGLVESMNSPIEFGIKNKETQLALYSPAQKTTTPLNLFSGCITASEMEMCEEYTCVITHGPNPKTMRFFDNCVVEGCGDVFALTPREASVKEDDFLASCDACKKKLGEGKDIFMYRGDKAFCSEECRNQEMLFDEQMDDDSWSENSTSTSL